MRHGAADNPRRSSSSSSAFHIPSLPENVGDMFRGSRMTTDEALVGRDRRTSSSSASVRDNNDARVHQRRKTGDSSRSHHNRHHHHSGDSSNHYAQGNGEDTGETVAPLTKNAVHGESIVPRSKGERSRELLRGLSAEVLRLKADAALQEAESLKWKQSSTERAARSDAELASLSDLIQRVALQLEHVQQKTRKIKKAVEESVAKWRDEDRKYVDEQLTRCIWYFGEVLQSTIMVEQDPSEGFMGGEGDRPPISVAKGEWLKLTHPAVSTVDTATGLTWVWSRCEVIDPFTASIMDYYVKVATTDGTVICLGNFGFWPRGSAAIGIDKLTDVFSGTRSSSFHDRKASGPVTRSNLYQQEEHQHQHQQQGVETRKRSVSTGPRVHYATDSVTDPWVQPVDVLVPRRYSAIVPTLSSSSSSSSLLPSSSSSSAFSLPSSLVNAHILRSIHGNREPLSLALPSSSSIPVTKTVVPVPPKKRLHEEQQQQQVAPSLPTVILPNPSNGSQRATHVVVRTQQSKDLLAPLIQGVITTDSGPTLIRDIPLSMDPGKQALVKQPIPLVMRPSEKSSPHLQEKEDKKRSAYKRKEITVQEPPIGVENSKSPTRGDVPFLTPSADRFSEIGGTIETRYQRSSSVQGNSLPETNRSSLQDKKGSTIKTNPVASLHQKQQQQHQQQRSPPPLPQPQLQPNGNQLNTALHNSLTISKDGPRQKKIVATLSHRVSSSVPKQRKTDMIAVRPHENEALRTIPTPTSPEKIAPQTKSNEAAESHTKDHKDDRTIEGKTGRIDNDGGNDNQTLAGENNTHGDNDGDTEYSDALSTIL